MHLSNPIYPNNLHERITQLYSYLTAVIFPINLSAAGQLEQPWDVNNSIITLEEAKVCKAVSLFAAIFLPDELVQNQQVNSKPAMIKTRSITKYAVFLETAYKVNSFFS